MAFILLEKVSRLGEKAICKARKMVKGLNTQQISYYPNPFNELCVFKVYPSTYIGLYIIGPILAISLILDIQRKLYVKLKKSVFVCVQLFLIIMSES